MIVAREIDTSMLRERLSSLYDALLASGGDVSNLIQDETRRLGKQIVNFIPPLKSRWGNPKSSGEKAIQNELQSLFSEADYQLIDRIGSEKGTKNVNAFITKENGDKLNLQWANIDAEGARMAEFHQKYRGNNGKVYKSAGGGTGVWKSRVIVPKGTREPFIKTVQRNVGMQRASWAKGPFQLGAKFPAWITRHFGKVDDWSTIDTTALASRTNPSITFGSRAPGNYRLTPRINAAVRARGQAIAKRIKLILSGYSQDISRGMRARTRELTTRPGNDEVVE